MRRVPVLARESGFADPRFIPGVGARVRPTRIERPQQSAA